MSTVLAVDSFILQTAASGAPVRLEYVRGRMKWEMSPASRHQMMVQRIERSIRPSRGAADACACFPLADVLIRFPDVDASLKRPDIAIFCSVPPAVDEALDLLPAAVVEVLSVGYEEKDLGPDGAAFYLAHGIADVLIVDPRGGTVQHLRVGAPPMTHPTPYTADLACGCRIAVP